MIAGQYVVGELLGRGAMGEVHLAVDQETGQAVALALATQPVDLTPAEALRFAERGRALARLAHPGLVRVLGHGLADPRTTFLAMALVPGRNLDLQLASGPLSVEVACRLIADVARALGALHARGLVHRDVKAANVRVTPEGRPVLLDFGLSGPLGESADGVVVTGTPAYLAPEAIAGGTITAATDLYALGCLAHELLAGRPPFLGRPAEVLRAQLASPPPPLDVPPAVADAIAALLRKAPGERMHDPEAVARRFEAAAGLVSEPEGAAGAGLPHADRLVGRDAELAVLASALDEVLAGQGRAVVVSAPAGVGKSRLVQEAVLAARLAGVVAVTVKCRADAAEPLQALREACQSMGGRLAPATRAAVERALDGGLACGRGEARDRHLEALAQGLAEAAPLLLVFDDLQWADAASLEAMLACQRLLVAEPVLWLATCRPEEAPPGHAAWHAVEEGLATRLTLAPLARDQADALLGALLGTPSPGGPFARMIFEATGGNAFFLAETLRHLIEEGMLRRERGQWQLQRTLERVDLPEAAEAAVLRRAANLPADAASLLQLAVTLGPLPARDVLAAASALTEAAYLAAVEPLLERQFLIAGAEGYRLPHDRLREAVYGAIPGERRRALHRGCGEALERLHPAPTPEIVAALAHHFTRGGEADRAYTYAMTAGDQARRAGMPARALAVWQEAEGLLAANDPENQDPRRQALWWSIGAAGFEPRPDLAATALERLLAVLPADAPQRVEAEAFLATAHGFAGRPRLGLAAAERAFALADGATEVLRAAARMVRGPSLLAAGRIDALLAVALEAEAVLGPLDPSEQPALVRATRVGAISYGLAVHYQGGTPPVGLRERALEAAGQAGAWNLFLTIRHYEALAAALAGRFAEAEAYLAWAAPYGRRASAPPHPWLLYLEALVPFQRGDFVAAGAAVERARLQPGLALAGAIRHQLDVLAARVQLAQGDSSAACSSLDRALIEARAEGLLLGQMQALIAIGELSTAEGRYADAAWTLAEAERLAAAGDARNPLYEGYVWRHQAALALAEGRPDDARKLVARALERMAALDQPLERARLQRLLGEAWLAAGDESAAVVALRGAAAVAEAIGHGEEMNRSGNLLRSAAAAAAAASERWDYLSAVLPALESW